MLKLNHQCLRHTDLDRLIQIQLLLKLNKTQHTYTVPKEIQIQLLLKLNARKINPYGFYYTIKSIDKQGF